MSNLNYFALEPAIVARIKECLPEVADAVYTPFSVDEMLELANDDVAVSVIYVGDRVGDSAGNGKANAVYQQWLVILSINDPEAQLAQTTSLRAIAAPWIVRLLRALQGFNPNTSPYKPLQRIDAGVSVGHASSYGYFPFLFESQMLVV